MYVVSIGASKTATSGGYTASCTVNGVSQSSLYGFAGAVGGWSGVWILDCKVGDVIVAISSLSSSTQSNAYVCIIG